MPSTQAAAREAGTAPTRTSHPAGDLTLLELLSMVLRHRMLIARTTVLFAIVGGIVALALPRSYTADFSFTPQESSSGGGLSAIASDFGVNIGSNESQSPDFYIDLIHTRELLWRLLDDKFTLASAKGPVTFSLIDSLEPPLPDPRIRRERATATLRKRISASVNLKTSVVSVNVKSSAAEISYQLALKLIDEINRFNAETRRSRAAAQRAFAEQRVQESRAALRVAEDRSEAWLNRNKIFSAAPELQYEKARLDRELALRDQEYIALMQQFQAARMEEVRNTPVITIVERPVLPARRDGRGAINKTILGAFFGFVLALLYGIIRESLRRSKAMQSDGLAEFAVLREELTDELRHPGDTLRRMFLLRPPSGRDSPTVQ